LVLFFKKEHSYLLFTSRTIPVPYNIHANCEIERIVSRRNLAQRAVKQARDYRKLGYTSVSIVDVDTGESYDAATLAAMIQAKAAPG
jgi:hypothetical protein